MDNCTIEPRQSTQVAARKGLAMKRHHHMDMTHDEFAHLLYSAESLDRVWPYLRQVDWHLETYAFEDDGARYLHSAARADLRWREGVCNQARRNVRDAREGMVTQ